MRNDECIRMRREFINDIVNVFFESGRHDRSKKWVWRHFIYPFLGIEYQTFLKETQPSLPPDPYRLIQLVVKCELLAERGKQLLEKQHCQHLIPQDKEIDEVLRQLKEIEP